MRSRDVVVQPALEPSALRVVECWVRRYRCIVCGAVPTVLPVGVMPRYLYSAGAIVLAFFLTAATPVGEGLTHADAYARQGMYAVTAWREASAYRWRSLERWADCLTRWWPGHAGSGPCALLISFIERASGGGLATLVEAAIRSHVRWGQAM